MNPLSSIRPHFGTVHTITVPASTHDVACMYFAEAINTASSGPVRGLFVLVGEDKAQIVIDSHSKPDAPNLCDHNLAKALKHLTQLSSSEAGFEVLEYTQAESGPPLSATRLLNQWG